MPRPRTPEKLKEMRGTAQPCRKRPELTPKDVLKVLPTAPLWVSNSPAAADEWLRLGSLLVAAGALTRSSLTAFGHLCLTHADMLAIRAAGKSPTGPQQASYLALCRAFRATAISTPAVAPQTNTANPFDRFKEPRQ